MRTSTTKENMIEIISFPWERGETRVSKSGKSCLLLLSFVGGASVMVIDVRLQTIKFNTSVLFTS